MAEFNIQSDSVDVTRIMGEIRQRILEKRGTDYTEQQIQELASVKLEQFLDPRQVRSDLVEHYRNLGPLDPIPDSGPGTDPIPEAVKFDEETIYVSSRGLMGTLIRLIRRLLNPILRLFFNPDPIIFAMSRQAEINIKTLELLRRQTDQMEQIGKKFAAREALDTLNYEVLNNLVVEMTRLAVDMKNHKMQVESVAGRLDFDERRAKALETVVQNRSSAQDGPGNSAESTGAATASNRTRRRRRRPRRRPVPSTQAADSTASGRSTSPQDLGQKPETADSQSLRAQAITDSAKAQASTSGKPTELPAAESSPVTSSSQNVVDPGVAPPQARDTDDQ